MTPAVGDVVRIVDHAPQLLRPGSEAVVVDVRRIDDEGVGCAQCQGDGAAVVRVRFDDGGELELADRLLLCRPG